MSNDAQLAIGTLHRYASEVPSHYSSLGFDFPTQAEFEQFTEDVAASAQPIETRHGSYLRWTSQSRAELWLQVNKHGELVGAHPHYAGDSSISIRATEHVRRPDDTVLDGAFHAWANPTVAGEGDYPFVFDCPNFHQVSGTALPAEGSAQMVGFAHEVKSFESPEHYAMEQTGEVKFASRSFIPAGLFGESGQAPAAHAIMTGHVLRAEHKVNREGGRDFIWASLDTLGGIFDVVADPTILPSLPPIGGILSGTFWLSGRVNVLTSRATLAGKLMHRLRTAG